MENFIFNLGQNVRIKINNTASDVIPALGCIGIVVDRTKSIFGVTNWYSVKLDSKTMLFKEEELDRRYKKGLVNSVGSNYEIK